MQFGRVDELEIPPLEERRSTTVTVISLWVEQAAEDDRAPL